jgi:LmbE family N-acetylglucosaminyl deacetylase
MPHTLVTVHAHPDDEAIATSGTMAKAKAAGHRVVLVVATRGELGEVPDDLTPDETLADRRTAETLAAAEIIGVDRVEFLGYRDSGMEGDVRNADAESFVSADVEEAAQRLAAILRAEDTDVLLSYDERGNYLHPDHIKVHLVANRAGELAAVPLVYEATMNTDYIWGLMHRRAEEMPRGEGAPELPPTIEELNLGMREWTITHRVDARAFIDVKRRAMVAHASQIAEQSFFLQMPLDAFREAFGYEWFIRIGAPRAEGAPFGDDLFAPLATISR